MQARLFICTNKIHQCCCNRVTRDVDLAFLVCLQFEQAVDTELAWLTEAEKKLSSMGEIRLEQDQTTALLQEQRVSVSHLVHLETPTVTI